MELAPCGCGIISLRQLILSDIDDLMEWAADGEVARFCRFEPYQSKEEGIDFINNVVLPHPWYCHGPKLERLSPLAQSNLTEHVVLTWSKKNEEFWYRAICLDGKPVGAISVTENKSSGSDRCRAELGYLLGSKYWGRGIATAAVKMAVASVFREGKGELERVEALVAVENVGSLRVLEKAGFTKEGVLRKYYKLKGTTMDFVMYSFLSTDPIP